MSFYNFIISTFSYIYVKIYLCRFFFAKQGEIQTSGNNTDIPPRLALREASVLCLSTSKFNKKGKKYVQRKRETRPKPSKKKKKKQSKINKRLRKSIIGQANSVAIEIQMQLSWKRI